MDQTNDIIHGYRQLIDLLEEELTAVSGCLKGEILDAYQSLLEKEVQRLKDHLHALRVYY